MEVKPTQEFDSLEWPELTVEELKSSSDNALATGPFGSSIGSRFFETEGVPVIRGNNLTNDGSTQFVDEGLVFVSEAKAAEFRRSMVTKGDLIFTCWGTINQVGLIGPKCLYGRYIISNKQMKFTPNTNKADSLFLFYLFFSPAIQSTIIHQSIGSSIPGFNLGQLRAMRLRVPPLPEQRAIATALSDVDALIAKLDQLIAKKRDIKQAAMQELLTGRKRLPGFEQKKGYKQTEVGRIPEDWEVASLGDCLSTRPSYGINASAVPYSDKLPVYLRITDINESGHFVPQSRVSVRDPDSANFFLVEGDIVFARTGASVGKSYLYKVRDGPLVFAGFLIRVNPDPLKLLPSYAAAYVSTGAYWNWVRLMSMRSGQPGINGNEYAKLPIPLPSLPEQRAIAAVLSDMDAEISALEARRDKTRALKQGMMQELLTGRIRLV